MKRFLCAILIATPLAAQTATQLKALGYAKVSTGNTSARSASTVVYYRDGAKEAAQRLAQDMQVATVTPIAGSLLAASAPSAAQVVVVLGAG